MGSAFCPLALPSVHGVPGSISPGEHSTLSPGMPSTRLVALSPLQQQSEPKRSEPRWEVEHQDLPFLENRLTQWGMWISAVRSTHRASSPPLVLQTLASASWETLCSDGCPEPSAAPVLSWDSHPCGCADCVSGRRNITRKLEV